MACPIIEMMYSKVNDIANIWWPTLGHRHQKTLKEDSLLGDLRWTIPVSEGSHLFVKWKEFKILHVAVAHFQSGNAAFSLQRWQGIIWTMFVGLQSGVIAIRPIARAGQEGLADRSNKAMIPEMWLVYSHLSKPWVSWGGAIQKCETLAVGVVVLEIPVPLF